jgi:hypothetical protein
MLRREAEEIPLVGSSRSVEHGVQRTVTVLPITFCLLSHNASKLYVYAPVAAEYHQFSRNRTTQQTTVRELILRVFKIPNRYVLLFIRQPVSVHNVSFLTSTGGPQISQGLPNVSTSPASY